MKYEKEYQDFVKQITEKFISFVTGDCPPKTWSGDSFCNDMYRDATEEEKSEFYKKNNESALNWLNENMITYNEWLTKHKQIC